MTCRSKGVYRFSFLLQNTIGWLLTGMAIGVSIIFTSSFDSQRRNDVSPYFVKLYDSQRAASASNLSFALLEFIYHSQILSVSGRLAHDKGGFIRLTHLFDLLFFILHMTAQDSCVLRRRWLDLLVVLQSRLNLFLTPMRK